MRYIVTMTNIAPMPARGSSEAANATVAANIRAELGYADIKQSVLAAALGQNEMWLSRRLNSKNPFTTNEVQAIADYFGIEVGDLFQRRSRATRETKPAPSDYKSAVSGELIDLFSREIVTVEEAADVA